MERQSRRVLERLEEGACCFAGLGQALPGISPFAALGSCSQAFKFLASGSRASRDARIVMLLNPTGGQ